MSIYDKVVNTLVVIVTYNRGNMIRKDIEAILGQTHKCELFIFNNGSSDNTAEILDEYKKNERVSIYSNDKNQGCSYGINFAMKYAISNDYKYIWVLDDDMIPNIDALERLFDAGEKIQGDWGCLSGGVYWENGKICKANRPKTGVFTFVTDKDYKKEYRQVKMVSWGAMLVKTDVIRKVGLPIKEYYVYTDDYEISYRISLASKVFFIPKSKTYHYIENNSKANVARDSLNRIDRYYYLFRNDFHFYRKMGICGYIYIGVKVLFNLLQVLLFSKNKMIRLKQITSGISSGKKFNPEIEMV